MFARLPTSRAPSLIALAAILLAPAAFAARGTDVTTGYEWWDTADGATLGPGFFDAGLTQLNPTDDSPPTPVPLPWSFWFYGTAYDQIWISDNGWISFQDPLGDAGPAPQTLPSAAALPLTVAGFWGDLDCSDPAASTSIRHGPISSAGAYRIQYSALDLASARSVLFDIYLFLDGRIKLQYRSVGSFSGKTVGLQEGTGADGFSVVDQGVPAAGVPDAPPPDYVIDIRPPALLPGECGLLPDLACGADTLPEGLPGTLPRNIALYGCSTTPYWARERLHTITVTEASRLQVTLTPGTGADLVMHLLQECSESQCLAGPVTSLDVVVGPGTYHLSVDAPFIADEGSYTLQVDCGPFGERIGCGDTVNDDTTGGPSLSFVPACTGSVNFSGPERFYTLDVPVPNSLRAELTAAAPELDLFLYRVPTNGLLDFGDCLQWSDTTLVLGGLPAGEYVVGVDGLAGAQGPFTLETSCAVDLVCTVEDTLDFTTESRHAIAGDTRFGAPGVSWYDCERDVRQDGAELVYELLLPAAGEVAIRELGGPSGLSVFVLDACNEGTCRGDQAGSCGDVLEAGIHYLVIDSPAGAEGPFDLEVIFSEPHGHWSDCEDLNVFPIPDPIPTAQTVWQFTDGAFCYSDPASHNYPDGCSFAVYVAIRCGTAFHVPLRDVESGHLRIYDLLREEYVVLTASSTSGWSAVGDDISWEDCAGDDPRWNDETTDIFFENPDGLCGVYRIEFPQHAGFEWDLYANCSGDTTEEYPLFDNLCDAWAAFDPLPDVYLVSADIVTDCPDFTATYTVGNDGCVEATDVTVSVFDDGALVASDVVPLVRPGETVTGVMSDTFPGGLTSNNVTIEVDAGNAVEECNEVPGAGCLGPRDDVLVVANCSPDCSVTAVANADPAVLCDGGTTTIDASASIANNCAAGTLEYQVSWPGGTIPWQASPVFPGLTPTEATDHDVEMRCENALGTQTCLDTVTVRVEVDWRPVFDPASVVALESPCDEGIQLIWAPATFLGPTGTGVYNVHRSTVSCEDAVTVGSPTRLLVGQTTGTLHVDATTVPGETYYYVIEAEDDTPVSGGCTPTGFNAGGAATRAEAPGGACAGFVERVDGDPLLLPKVGPTLRVGRPEAYGPTVAPLHWDTDEAIDLPAGEHFHVLRSVSPDVGFAQVNPLGPPLLQAPRYVDAAAGGSSVQHYLVFVSTACHRDNEGDDRFGWPSP